MLKIAILYLVLFAQVPPPPKPAPAQASSRVSVTGNLTVPAYTIVKLKANGFAGPVVWKIYTLTGENVVTNGVSTYADTNGINFNFVGYPGTYLSNASDGNSSVEVQVTIQPPGILPPAPVTPVPVNPVPIVPPTPAPVSPDPAPDPSGFIYPPSTNTNTPSSPLSDGIVKSLSANPDKAQAKVDAKSFNLLYAFCATKVWLDGLRQKPGLQTVSQVSALVRSEEDALTQATPVKSIKEGYPELRLQILKEFQNRLGKSDELTPETRKEYVLFLRELAAGFAKVAQ